MPYGERQVIPITIANGASVSSAIQLKGMILVGLYMPSAWTSTAVSLRFEASEDGSTWYPILDSGGNYLRININQGYYTTPFASFITTVGVDLQPANFIRLVSSDINQSAVNQGADRALSAVVRPYLN